MQAAARQRAHLWPVLPLEVGRLQRLWQRKPVIDRDELIRGLLQQRSRRRGRRAAVGTRGQRQAAHEDVTSVAVGVEEPDIEDADAVDVAHWEARRAHVAAVAVVRHVLLQRAALEGQRLAAVGDVEYRVPHLHQHRVGDARKVAVVEQVGGRLQHVGREGGRRRPGVGAAAAAAPGCGHNSRTVAARQ
jgi:hypothetical protein